MYTNNEESSTYNYHDGIVHEINSPSDGALKRAKVWIINNKLTFALICILIAVLSVIALAVFVLFVMLIVSNSTPSSKPQKYTQVKHVIVIIMENWSYDGLFGFIENANGLANASIEAKTQVDRSGNPYTSLPMIQEGVPKNLPNGPFDLSQYVNDTTKTIDLTHQFYTEQYQINNGKMNSFVAYGTAQGLTVSHYDARNTYLGQLAQNYTLFDHWFHPIFGNSYANHQWLITPHTPVFPNAPKEIINVEDPVTHLLVNPDAETLITPDYYTVGTMCTVGQPRCDWQKNESYLVPLQEQKTIGDLLTEHKISWSWYGGGYKDAMEGRADPTFQYHHQPFTYYKNFDVGTEGRTHLKDGSELFENLASETLEQVVFYKPLGRYNFHPGYSIVGGEAMEHLQHLIESIKKSKYWDESMIFITFDEHGGRWDHVAPPKVDRWGPGSRIPTIALGPFVKQRYVDSTYRDTTAIMKFIQDRFGMPSLGTRDAMQNPFDSIFK